MTRPNRSYLSAGLAALAMASPCLAQKIDRPKARVEFPTKRLLAAGTANAPASAEGFANPKVSPGNVRWHPSFDDACKAARASGKPVLLFQMMGRLDEKFC